MPVNIGDAMGALDDSASLNPLIFDWSIPASDEISAFEMVASSIFAEVIEPSATEGVIPVNPEPSPENELAVIVPVDEIEPEVIVPVNIGDAKGALDDRASLNPLIFDWSIPASDEMSAFEMVASSIFAEVIEPSATEVKFINPEPSPEN